jgi:protein-tyrosine phosphatase
VHCTAGKDRTGVSVALVLDAVGAERAAVVADYAASAANLAGPWADGMRAMITAMGVPLTPEIDTLVTATPPAAIEQALAWVDAQGGAAEYLQSGGLTDAELDALRARLTA